MLGYFLDIILNSMQPIGNFRVNDNIVVFTQMSTLLHFKRSLLTLHDGSILLRIARI